MHSKVTPRERQMPPESRPLVGVRVLDFSQFLAGPFTALRLADLGATVVKVERKHTGESGRRTGRVMMIDEDSYAFHAINRNKESIFLDLKDDADKARLRPLVRGADVLIENFRPGVMSRLGLDYGALSGENPRLIYGRVTGYGDEGPWADRPGQDLLLQAASGAMWMQGGAADPPTAVGLSIVDQAAGHNLLEGILAALLRRERTQRGALVEVNLFESAIDLQFEPFTAFLNDRDKTPQRGSVAPAHPYISALYGVYRARDGWIALAHASIPELGRFLGLEELLHYTDPASWFTSRDELKLVLEREFIEHPVKDLVSRLLKGGFWVAEVMTWPDLLEEAAFNALEMVQYVHRPGGPSVASLRCPVQMDGQVLTSPKAAPRLSNQWTFSWEERE